MRAFAIAVSFASFAAAPASPALAENRPVSIPSISEAIQKEVTDGFSGTVLVAKGDRVLLSRGFGSIHGIPMRPATRFWISSTGKQFVAAAILLLQQQGKLSLSDPISRFLPEAPADKGGITIAQLLSHTSGIVQGYEGEGSSSNAEAVRRILAVPLETPRTHQFVYSNENYQLLAAIVERISGLRYQEFEQRHFFAPLHLTNSGIAQGPAGVAPTRDATPDRLKKANWGIEGHYSSAGDLFHWYRALSSGKVLSRASLDQLWSPVVPIGEGQAALGWFLTKMPSGTRRVWTRGNDDFGPNSLIYAYPDRDLVIIILTHGGQKTEDISWSRALIGDLEAALKL